VGSQNFRGKEGAVGNRKGRIVERIEERENGREGSILSSFGREARERSTRQRHFTRSANLNFPV
jgi:hypothetical protein